MRIVQRHRSRPAIPAWLALAGCVATLALACPRPVPGATLDEALALGRAEHYAAAVDSLEVLLSRDPRNADLHYYLAFFLHHLYYDSVPYPGFDREHSDQVLRHLGRALELDPDLGDARYMIGAEYGARALADLQRGDLAGAAQQYRLGREAGGYPDWMVQAARNVLRSCPPGALLFVGGDAEASPLLYLQLVRHERPDVSVLPLGLLDRPWFVRLIARGIDGVIAAVPLGWSEDQILSLRPYKWQAARVTCRLPERVRQAYGVERDVVEWVVEPDLERDDGQSLLSATRAVITRILQANAWERPVLFSFGCQPSAWGTLGSNLQLHGFAQRLWPVAPEEPVALAAADRFVPADVIPVPEGLRQGMAALRSRLDGGGP